MRYNKFFILASILFISGYAEAQRVIDLSIGVLYKPEYIVSSSGTEALFSIRNNGPDTIFTSDSVIIYFVFDSQQSNLIVRKPDKTMAPNDTQLLTISIKSLPPVSTSGLKQFCINASIMNRSADSVKVELATASDNQKCNLVYVNGTDIKFLDPKSLDVKTWPNPSAGNIILSFNNPERTEKGRITLMDAEGRYVNTLYEGSIESGKQEFAFNTASLAPGVYYYTLFFDQKAVINNFIVSN